MADVRVDLAGLVLDSPLVLASGPLSWNGEAIVRARRAGASAVVTKTISRGAAGSPRPHIAALRSGLLNAERWSDLPPEQWIERELPLAKDAGATVIASVGPAPGDAAALVRALEQAGADALEVVSYEEAALPGMVRAAVRRVRIPVFAKLSANGRDLAGTAKRCAARGASAITAIDSLGPALRIDLERRRPLLGADSAWLSGEAILPIALHAVRVVHSAAAVPIVGTGGVTNADAAIEMLLAGATAVGLCSAPLAQGLGLFARLRDEMARRLDDLGFASARDASGALCAAISEESTLGVHMGACTRCGACVRLCPYEARRSPETVEASCRECGLCASACPTKALGWKRSGT